MYVTLNVDGLPAVNVSGVSDAEPAPAGIWCAIKREAAIRNISMQTVVNNNERDT